MSACAAQSSPDDTVARQPVGHRRHLTDTHSKTKHISTSTTSTTSSKSIKLITSILRVTAFPTPAALHDVSTASSTRSAFPRVQWHGMRLEGQGKQTLGGCHVAV
mmetsp:Transcript_2657/g.10554  ORF Transcript_2657/g.10554 Transcript_2657/m.10554 type:complete len:105 (+) Transcript_2657:427-741(+)